MSELDEIRKSVGDARDHGRCPTLALMSPETWFRLKAQYVEETGAHDVTFRDVLGTDVFFDFTAHVPLLVFEDQAS